MRSLITLVFSFSMMVSWGQTEGNNIQLNNSTVTNSVEEEKSEELEFVADSTIIETEELETIDNSYRKKDKSIRGIKKSKEMASPATERTLEAPVPVEISEEEDAGNVPSAPASTKAAEFQSVSYGFQVSRKNASVQRSQRSPSLEQQMQMDEAVEYFETNSPNSFEHHYFKYVSGNYDVSLISNLKEAEKLRPENTDVHVQMAGYNMIKRNTDSALIYMEKLKDAGRLTENVIHYAEDVLLSVPENGVLITHGFDDSYGTWYNQKSSGIRKDVQLISLDFLQSAHYRALLKEDGFKLPEGEVIDVTYLKDFCEMNATKELSISLTTPKEYFEPIQDNLYITGLAFEYHEGAFENFERNDKLWNSDLKKHLVDNATDEKSKQLSSNYLPMLLQLRKVYAQKGEEDKLKDVDEALDKVSVQCKKYEKVQQLKNSY